MKKSTTRIAAILIAIVMLIGCSVGMISASASPNYENATVTSMKNALGNYEKMFTGANAGKIYTNMAAAYNAYVKLSNDLDLYYYSNGGNTEVTSGDIDNHIRQLNTAIGNMEEWEAKAIETQGIGDGDKLFAADSKDWSVIKSYFKNVIWAEKNTYVGDNLQNNGSYVGYEGRAHWDGTNNNAVSFRLFYPQYVLIYDGNTNPEFGVMFETDTQFHGDGVNRNRWFYGASMTANANTQGMSLYTGWRTADNNDSDKWGQSGTGGKTQYYTRDFSWNLIDYVRTLNYRTLANGGYDYNTGVKVKISRLSNTTTDVSRKMYSNMVRFNGTFNGSYFVRLTPEFIGYAGGNATPSADNVDNHYWYTDITNDNDPLKGDAYVYALNYKAVTDAMETFSAKLKDISKYKEGGLSTAIAALDKATSYDYNYDFSQVTGVSQLDAKVQQVASDFSSWVTDMTAATQQDQYGELRAAIDKTTKTYFEDTATNGGVNPTAADGINVKYCPTPWATFADYYKQAGTVGGVMYNAAKNKSYTNGTEAGNLATRLSDAFDKLDLHQPDSTDNWTVIPEEAGYKKADCENPGLGRELSKCAKCSDTNFIVTDKKVIESLGHQCVFTKESGQSCTEPGTPAYWQCVWAGDDLHEPGCGTYFDDDDGKVGDVLPEGPKQLDKLGHNLINIATQREATCQQDGYKQTIYQCDQCHKYYFINDDQNTDQPEVPLETVQDNVIQKINHNETIFQEEKSATCTAPGNPAYYQCDMCNHYFSAEDNYDERQDLGVIQPTIPQLAHVFTNYVYDVASQADDKCVTPGTMTALCDNGCETTDTQLDPAHPAIGHSFELDGAMHEREMPTCYDAGKILYYTCDNCKKNFATDSSDSVVPLTEDQLNIPATGEHVLIHHSSRTATCQQAGYSQYWECSVCKKLFKSSNQVAAGDITNFDDKNEIKDLTKWEYYTPAGKHKLITHNARTATCETKGYDTYYECAYCARLFESNDQGDDPVKFDKENEIKNFDGDGDDAWAKLGSHSVKYFSGLVANCVEGGEEDHYECIYCDTWFSDDSGSDDKIIDSVNPTDPDPNNHVGVWTYHEADDDPSCTSEWWTTSCWECLGCGNFYADKDQATTNDALDQSIMKEPVEHNQDGTRDAAIIIQDPTCYYEGSQIRYKYCTLCNTNQDFETESIPMKAHTPSTSEPIETDSTCQEKGLKPHYVCSVAECGKYLDANDPEFKTSVARADLEKDLANHDFGDVADWTTVVTPADCTTNAMVQGTCAYGCGALSEPTEKENSKLGHTMTPHEKQEASCLESGVPETYYSCEVCNLNYADNEAYTTNVYTGNITTPATGHSFKLVDDNAKAATCHEKGELAYYICENENCELKDAKFLSNADNMAKEGIKSNDELIIDEDEKNHTALAFVTGTPATCKGWKSGMRDHNYCADCSSYYEVSDVNYDTVIKNENVFVLAPTHTLTHNDPTPKACLESGKIEHWSCDVCGELFKGNTPDIEKGVPASEITIEADGHNFGAYVPADEATCVTPSKAGHVECQDCGIKVICDEANVNTHDVLWYEGDDSEKIDGDINPDNHINTVNHDHVPATCVVKAVDAYTECKDCGKLFTADGSETTLDALTHDVDLNNHVNVVPVTGTAPGCEVDGVKNHFKCNDCDKEFLDQDCTTEATEDNIKDPALGHDPQGDFVTDPDSIVNGTCIKKGTHDEYQLCDRCNKPVEETRKTVEDDFGEHVYGRTEKQNVVEATCTGEGSYDEVTICAVCDKAYGDPVHHTEDALGHTPGEVKTETVKEATCTEGGIIEETQLCDRCGEPMADPVTKTTDALGHTPGEVKTETVKEATCTGGGIIEETQLCDRCGEPMADPVTKTTDALGHTPGEAKEENRVEPTETTDGGYDLVVRCTVCREVLESTHVTLPATGSGEDPTDEPTTDEPTTDEPTTDVTDEDELKILEGENLTYVIDSFIDKTIVCSGNFNLFRGVLLNGETVDKDNYTVYEGSTVVTFKSEFLNTLAPGKYSVTLMYTYDSISTSLTVIENTTETTTETTTEDTTKAPGNGNGSGSNSGTSPNTGLAITIPVFSLAALAGGFFSLGYARKKKNEDEE